MEGLLFFRVYPSDGFRFILIPDGNPSHEFPVLDGNASSNMNSASNDNKLPPTQNSSETSVLINIINL
jgi:hypothetical protein